MLARVRDLAKVTRLAQVMVLLLPTVQASAKVMESKVRMLVKVMESNVRMLAKVMESKVQVSAKVMGLVEVLEMVLVMVMLVRSLCHRRRCCC